ncbi:hypothetical protein A2526_01065 [candidate division WOR-1 bacterium RIFOXYD2_FULL_36_8]|uniref:Fis family transcriptional regulator n=1 Tax=candidate division WOR-1 bacterium RIFOXYB2_FULL_36_35 TaxID=1802578 RepID=A0A1F4S2R6_UNCSA|nr:MAG: hypothetical protein A2230_07680 [candidate division WOR-1 bacterium RIFOXYA2_FULL_36_21]OGC14734.1 MAG: hypothetical protein A2290_08565 [candidate division WOR-1 bacterium RIFOXYB2_FULL_36_35]OGC21256.1 MAG: hypothetical protein A2282_01880 [candidate division WOR-1 bacterium RIFOXYA12_FULL_36_13]OGC38046.1 MAG: hypothetical protein A2526_01065 [candidate division WOR-1 bacterium RIFOXYD2_FULL_36_8]
MTNKKDIILAIDDDDCMLITYEAVLRKHYDVIATPSGTDGLEILKNQSINLVLLDYMMPQIDGLEVLRKIKEIDSDIEVIMITAADEAKAAVQAIKLGAYDYITKPFEVETLLAVIKNVLDKQNLKKENLCLKKIVDDEFKDIDLIGNSFVIKKIKEQIASLYDVDSTILITGETGTGKEVVARAIHKLSLRRRHPFVSVNCAAIPENLFESELFGYERGAFTGAFERNIGKFELADQGTIFLDEIGSLPMTMQSKLLRVLENKSFERVGGHKLITSDVRIISATNANLKESIEKETFREDLFYRLNVINIEILPLRERREDIEPLLLFFFDKFCRELKRKNIKLSHRVFDFASSYEWTGNVRELKNFVERLVVLGEEVLIKDKSRLFTVKPEINPDDHKSGLEIPSGRGKELDSDPPVGFKEAVRQFEIDHIKRALEKTEGNKSSAAKILGLSRTTLASRIQALKIE